MRAIRGALALALLLLRHWARASLPNRVRRDQGRRASAGFFRLGYFGMMSAWGYTVGRLVWNLGQSEQRVRGAAWILVGSIGLAVVWSGLTRGPTLRGDPSPLEASFLETLPLRQTSRLAVGLLERVFVYALGGAALVGVAPEAPGRAILVAAFLSTSGIFVGEALMRAARVFVPAMTIARARGYLLVFGQVFFLMCIVQAPSLGRSPRIGLVVAGWPSRLARAVFDGNGFGSVLGLAALALGLAALAIVLAERIGYDKIDLVPTARPRRSKGGDLVIDRVDDVLRRREPGGRWSTVVMTAYTAVATGAIVLFSWGSRKVSAEDAGAMIRFVAGLAAFGSFIVVSTRASRMATRDVAARPLLSPLPIEPRALLGGKVSRLRRDALLVAAPTIALLATPWSFALHVEIVWRVAAILGAVVLGAKAAASIAFLTVGAGNRKGPGGSFMVESFLVLVPLVGVATAPYAWSVVVPLAALGLVAREAGRSGLGCVRWLDDADDFERETPIWRALLVLAAFHSAQMLTGRLVGLSEFAPGTQLAVAYAASSVVLVALTFQGRRDAPPIRALPPARVGLWLGAGVLAGAASGSVAFGYLGLVRRLGIELPSPDGASRVAIGVMAVLFAPIAEEIFFRGWLYACIEDELAPHRKRWVAPFVSAFAFAAVHPPLSFLPVFVLGVVTSVLFARTRALGPGIVAHVVHNALAVVLFA